MKTKIVLFTFLLTSILSNAQIKNGMYKSPYSNSADNDFICINGDTITICRWNYKACFKGAYQLKDDKICLSENILLGKNAYITKEKCSPDSIELRLITKHKHYLLGMPSNDTNIYEYESNLYTMIINKTPLISRDTNGIYIAKGQLTDEVLANGFLFDDSGAGFQDYFTLPLEYGTRYIVKHKYHEFSPSIINEKYASSFVFLYDYENNRIVIKKNYRDRNSEIYDYINTNCDSCFNEIKNRFPLLFE